jgi:O-antigen ligase
MTLRGLRPYGPFVNRNDFAGWLIMAMPLTLAYAGARALSRRRTGEPTDQAIAFDSKTLWLALAACSMLGGLLGSLSRSGLLGACVGLACLGWSVRRRLTGGRAGVALGGLLVALMIATIYADPGALATRLQGSFSEGFGSRLSIWRQTWPAIRDFWPFGVGAGAYESVMIRYQTLSRYFYISHSGNEFLQILAEGGLLLGAPIALAIGSGTWTAARRLREDATPVFWLRSGAVAGMMALAAQNMVEMTLRVPANAVMFTVLAAIATHEEDDYRSRRST